VNAPGPSADLRARVLAATRAEPSPTRAARVRRSALVVAAGFAPAVILSSLIGGPSVDGRPLSYMLALTLAWLLIGTTATWGGVARGPSMLGRPSAWKIVVAVVTPAALVATAIVAGVAWPETLGDPASTRAHVVCIALTLVCGLGPLVAFAFVRRGSDPVSPRLTGAGIGAAAGAWGAVAIELHCGHTSLMHITLGHVAPVLVLGLLGLIVGDRVVAVRAKNA
jgi:hypothetical protein